MSEDKIDRLEFIDALRGLAALYVVMYHLVLLPTPDLKMSPIFANIISFGGSGVVLFFVISGFTMAYLSRRREGEENGTAKFFIRRFFRIMPLYYAWLIFYPIYFLVSANARRSLTDILLSISMLFNLIPSKYEGIVPASWTLGIEILFYLVFPYLYKKVNNLYAGLIALFISMILADKYSWVVTTYNLINEETRAVYLERTIFTNIPIFIFGMLIYFIYEKLREKDTSYYLGVLLLVISLWGFNTYIEGKLEWFTLIMPHHKQAFLYGLLIISLSLFPWKVIVNKITVYLGKISYSVYLGHVICISYLFPIYKIIYTWKIPHTFQYGLCLILTLGCVIPLASITYRLIEAPFINYSKQLVKNMSFKRKEGDATANTLTMRS